MAVLGRSPSRSSISCSRICVGSFALHGCVGHMVPAQPHCPVCPAWGGDRVLLLPDVLRRLQEGPTGSGDWWPMRKLLSLARPQVSRAAASRAGLALPLVTLMAGCSGQKWSLREQPTGATTWTSPQRCAWQSAVLVVGRWLSNHREHVGLLPTEQ